MRGISIGLAVMAGLSLAVAAYFYSIARTLTAGILSGVGGNAVLQVAAIQTSMQMTAAAILAAVIFVSTACLVHAVASARNIG